MFYYYVECHSRNGIYITLFLTLYYYTIVPRKWCIELQNPHDPIFKLYYCVLFNAQCTLQLHYLHIAKPFMYLFLIVILSNVHFVYLLPNSRENYSISVLSFNFQSLQLQFHSTVTICY